ncbi:MAG TPA: TIGR03619 family F420-dependent LLM class oxidoreductase [Chloroflexota bacterium]
MKLGLAGINVGTMAAPGFGPLAALAESLGYESLWTAEHIILADLPPGETPRPGTTPFLDSMAGLGFLAAHTQTMKLATGVLLLPQHNPLLLAKQLASVDVLSNGRLIVGIGVGSIEAEAVGMGAPMHERGARANDYLNAMIALWTQEHPHYTGRHVSFEGINAYPRPVQKPYPPFVVGGRADGALRRTVRYAAGWYGYAMSLEQTRELLQRLSAVGEKVQRPAALGDIEITIAPSEKITSETIAAYTEIGVSRLLVRPPQDRGLEAVEASIREYAPLIGS